MQHDFDLMREDIADRRYLDPEPYAPANVEPEWLEPEGHEGGGPTWSCEACASCGFGLLEAGVCYRCEIGCPNGCGPLDRDCFCVVCGATTFLNQHPALRVLEEAA